jgi:AcrR family transcriptional regulator
MRAPSLYSYFESKDAIYDAMFAQGQVELGEYMSFLPDHDLTREDFRAGARAFFEFCTSDPVRYQLLFQRTLPGFEPSPETYALATDRLERLEAQLASAGVSHRRHLDLWTAILTGLTSQQISNDPGGDRWARLLDDVVDLFCDHAGVPPTRPIKNPNTTTTRSRK